MKKLFLSLILTISLLYSDAWAFDNETTHKDLTREAIEFSSLDEHVKTNLDLLDGVRMFLAKKTIREWLRDGSKLENVPQCRASNHFHNPLRDWTESGMRDQPWFVDWWCSESEYQPKDIKS